MSQKALEYPLLILDTSSRRTWVGLKLAADQLLARSEEQDPSKTLFRLLEELLDQTEVSLSELKSIAFCAGPGSMLGARTTSMAIRAWKGIGIPAAENVYFYNSLQIGALLAAKSEQNGLVVTDARRSSWNALPFPYDSAESLRLIENQELENLQQPLVSFAEFPAWTKTEAAITLLTYDPSPIFEKEDFLQLLSLTENATPLTIRHNEFKKWEAKIHSAPHQ
ncbi:hypothetical protein [Pelagicoccus mobilis]|uniref:Gcp-like domain-containing protein n=1 Tax=Pelagicoccus mobilis TaxID=415221 RepID=A0A934VTY4_9BACT|nr:hypothetical protein [Pelagicoccus mobilis]MBK1880550.1 hypothetical protein [Pelagicoccus mobilis]